MRYDYWVCECVVVEMLKIITETYKLMLMKTISKLLQFT